MKLQRSVCPLCRHGLAARPHTGVAMAQWQTRTYLTDEASVASSSSSSRRDVSRSPLAASRPSRVPSHRANRSDRVSSSPPIDVDGLFRNIVAKQGLGGTSGSANGKREAEAQGPRSVTPQKVILDLGQLQRMKEESEAPLRMYAFFKESLYSAMYNDRLQRPRVFSQVIAGLMDRMLTAKSAAIDDPSYPSLAEILRISDHIGALRPARWISLMKRLLHRIQQSGPSRNEVLLDDLVESWKVFSQPKPRTDRQSRKLLSMDPDEFWFPAIDNAFIRKTAKSKDVIQAVARLFLQQRSDSKPEALGVLALATYALLLDPLGSNGTAQKAASEFLAKVEYIARLVPPDRVSLALHIGEELPGLEPYVSAQLSRLAGFESLSPRAPVPMASLVESKADDGNVSFDRVGQQLAAAYGKRNMAKVDKLWQYFSSRLNPTNTDEVARRLATPELFNSFINTYMALNQPDKAIVVWNLLPRFGLKPTQKTWNVMLDGCKKAHNVTGLDNAWKKLRASGLPLDMPLWVTRISGLCECGELERAVEALKEMCRLYKTAVARGQEDLAVKPSIEPVNAVLGGLVRNDRLDAAEELLAWAGQQGITPDIWTFNTILRPLVRQGRDKQVQALFAAMTELGLEPDAASFTIILDGTLARQDVLHSPEKQEQAVKMVFKSMENVGLQVNMQTYSKMIYLLLKGGDRAAETVKAVLAHLWARGLDLNPHIYTILVDHYFSLHPPDLASVDSLLKRHKMSSRDEMDRVFFDRIVQGYSRADMPDKALKLFHRVQSSGAQIILGTQHELLQCLIRAELFEDAREVVRSTVEMYKSLYGKDFRGPDHARFWKHAFWHAAERNDLLDLSSLDVPPEKELVL